jgi:hypothetical protein
MISLNRQLSIAIAVLAAALYGCAAQEPPPPSPTAAQLAPMPQPATTRPRITGAMILSQQTPEVQQAIQHGPPWPTFRWPRERLVPYTRHAPPLTLDLSSKDAVDLALQRGESIDGVSLGDSEEFMPAPIMSALPHLILKCKVPGTDTTGAVYVSSGRIYRLHLRCRDKTTLDSVSYYYPEQLLAFMHAADAALCVRLRLRNGQLPRSGAPGCETVWPLPCRFLGVHRRRQAKPDNCRAMCKPS